MDDLLTEQCEYRDEGCDLFPSCLGCPLPRCRYDEQGKEQVGKRWRNNEILRLRSKEGKSVKELARSFGLSKRTVQRIVRRARGE